MTIKNQAIDLQKITSLEEYKDLLKETLFELADLRASVDYDEEFSEGVFSFVNELETGVKDLLTCIEKGEYEFSKDELRFMKEVEKAPNYLLPFKSLFKIIESTHKQGLAKNLLK